MALAEEATALIAAVEAGYLRRDAWQAWAERRMLADGAIPPWLHALSSSRDVDDALAALWEGLHESERASTDALSAEIDGTSLRLGFLFLRHQRGEIDVAALLSAAGELTDRANYDRPTCEAFFTLLNEADAGRAPTERVEALFAEHAEAARRCLAVLDV